MDRLSDLLSHSLARRGMADHAYASQVVHRANAWIAEHHSALSEIALAKTFSDGVLTFQCSHAIGLNELKNCEVALLEDIKKDFPALRILSIRAVRA